jgi:hypothetical protein
MAKPSEDMKDKLKATEILPPAEVDTLSTVFEKNYIFNREPPGDVVDVMFEVFFTGYVAGRQPVCGPVRCAACDGKCGK